MPAYICREPVSEVKRVGSAFIQDKGRLKAAVRASSTGWYLFSEAGIGPTPIVIIGTLAEVTVWLKENKHIGIENRIVELPEIYMTVQPYIPGSQFVGLFPVHAAVQALAENIAGFAPGSELTDIAGGIKDLMGAQKARKGRFFDDVFSRSKAPKAPKPGMLYLRFHYLPSEHMSKVGEKKVAFEAVHDFLIELLE